MTHAADTLRRPTTGLARFAVDGEVFVGQVDSDTVTGLQVDWIEALELCANSEPLPLTGRSWPLASVALLPPVDPTCRGVMCVGMNYMRHTAELGSRVGSADRSEPVVFMKLRESLAAPADPIEVLPEVSREFDWEVELGVIIGRRGRLIPTVEAERYIAAYTLVNDVTARDLQRTHGQWFLGKNVSHTTPVGPWAVPRASYPYPPEFDLRLSINGVTKQVGNTSEMVHGIESLIAVISRSVELLPGDVIATGTPDGVGFTRTPPEFLAPGDVVRAEIVGIMTLENKVV